MIGIVTFETAKGGIVAVEVDATAALADGGRVQSSGMVAKGSAVAAEVVVRSPTSFAEAMSTFKACAAGLEELIRDLDVVPSEVGVEFSLKMSGSAGFIIAKAGAESEMKVALKWTPTKVRS